MELKGKAHKFGDDVNTDYIISGRYKFKIQDPHELAKHLMEDLKSDFYKKISAGGESASAKGRCAPGAKRGKRGDFIVAGRNFGCGSSREQAPLAIKYAGVCAVLAKSFARIFFRNSINIGLMLLECDTDAISDGDYLLVNIKRGLVYNKTKNMKIQIRPLPNFILKILKDGGLVNHFKRHKGFKF
ncbi:MAG: 3-isopropylmalate dehydratase small subunit [Candidatus Omnitrophota bacterium]|nr:MAG: 3-isopropylmalate dehydratase small subunit [Candidatus Omnitrophota bacterium]